MAKQEQVKIDQDKPVHPNAICKIADVDRRFANSGTLAGYSVDLLPRYKELLTSSTRLCKRHDGLKSAAKAKKMGHGKKR
jgi:hypothetical protein